MKQSKVCIGLINPKSPDNVHSVMRAAGNFRVDSVFYNGSRYERALRLNPNAPANDPTLQTYPSNPMFLNVIHK